MTSSVLSTLICDVVAFILAASLLTLNIRHGKKHDSLNNIFSVILTITLILAVIDAVVIAFGFHVKYDTSLIELIFAIGNETLITVLCLVWMAYVNYRLYHNKAYIMRRFWVFTMPLIIILVATIIFSVVYYATGFISLVRADVVLYFSLVALRIIYFLVSVFRLNQYKKHSGTMRSFKISYLLIPVIVTGFLGLFFDGS